MMISDREVYEWSPEVGDRIEVILGTISHKGIDLGRATLSRGVLVSKYAGRCWVHLDSIRGYPEYTATYRPDQVRRERTIAEHLENTLERIVEETAKRKKWWEKKAPQLELDAITAYTVARSIHHQFATKNVASEILTETEDGLKPGSLVSIWNKNTPEQELTEYPGVFVAEYKGKRHVIYDTHFGPATGGAAAYDKKFVIPRK